MRLLLRLLGVWVLVAYGAALVFADQLNAFTLPGTGFPLGFWFAQQGAIYVFVGLIFFYAAAMNRLDHQFGVADD